MKLLIINGSPKGEKSNSLRLARAFAEGTKAEDVREFTLAQKHIGHCLGCFACWGYTPGKCVQKDDMAELLSLIVWADVLVYAFPLYYFGVPGLLKNAIDRQLPLVLPQHNSRADEGGSGSHPTRIDFSQKRYVLISTCGFFSAKNNYNAVEAMFSHFLPRFEHIYCGQGELFRQERREFTYPGARFTPEEIIARTDEYLNLCRQAGGEFASGSLSPIIKEALAEDLFPQKQFENDINAFWTHREESQK